MFRVIFQSSGDRNMARIVCEQLCLPLQATVRQKANVYRQYFTQAGSSTMGRCVQNDTRTVWMTWHGSRKSRRYLGYG
jgi:hypothetical protein